MKLHFSIIAAVFGFVASGPLGAIIGFLIGMYIDYSRNSSTQNKSNYGPSENTSYPRANQPQDFKHSLLILISAIMNADGSVMKSELEMVKSMLVRTYGKDESLKLLLRLRELIKQSHNLIEVCRNLRIRMHYASRLELVHILFRISQADSHISNPELALIQHIATQLGISTPDYLSIRAMFVVSVNSDYQILEISPSAGEEETKKAYRKMVMRFHPDRLQGLNSAEKKAAEAKFISVQKAYEHIKKNKSWL